MKIIKISLDKKNRMLRLGFGKNNNKWFIRTDLWFIAFRITWIRYNTWSMEWSILKFYGMENLDSSANRNKLA